MTTLSPSQRWDELRQQMQNSSYLKFPLRDLAKEWGLQWNIKARNETPQKYVKLSWQELVENLVKRKTKSREKILLAIFEKTLEFDDALVELEADEPEAPQSNTTIAFPDLNTLPKTTPVASENEEPAEIVPLQAETETAATPPLSIAEAAATINQEATLSEPETAADTTPFENIPEPIEETPETSNFLNEVEAAFTDDTAPIESIEEPMPTVDTPLEDETSLDDRAKEIEALFDDFEAPKGLQDTEDFTPKSLEPSEGKVYDPGDSLAPNLQDITREKDLESIDPLSILHSEGAPNATAEPTEPETPVEETVFYSQSIATETNESDGLDNTVKSDKSKTLTDSIIALLNDWEIPLDFPIKFMGLTPEERSFCQQHEATVLQDVIQFYDDGNSLNNFNDDEPSCDEEAKLKELCHNIFMGSEEDVAQTLPVRIDCKGIYLPEAIATLLRSFPEQYQTVLLNRLGNEIMLECCASGENAREDVKEIESEFLSKMRELLTWFPQDRDQLWESWADAQPLDAFFSIHKDKRLQKAAATSIATVFEYSPEGKEVIDARHKLFKEWVHELALIPDRELEELNLAHFLASKQKNNLLEEFALFGKKYEYFEYVFSQKKIIPRDRLLTETDRDEFKKLFCTKNGCKEDVFEKRVLSSCIKRGSVTLPLFLAIKRGAFSSEMEIINRLGETKSYYQFNREVTQTFEENISKQEENKLNMTFTKESLLRLGKKIFEE